jgi:arylsulfatase A-like enzyme
MRKIFKYFTILPAIALFFNCTKVENKPPNILIIYADDMGYGDLNCQNPDSKIPTPYLDRLASEGMRFTDAHSSSGICSPSRFALLTGMYHWRRQHGIVNSFGKPFFNNSDVTLPRVLRQNGYATACIGKWHLGWDWEFKNEPSGEVLQWGRLQKFYHPEDIDWSKPIAGGPLDRGFDYYFGDGTINFPPYAWVENDRIIEAPSEVMDINKGGYGDFMYQTDWVIGQVLNAIKEKGLEDNTIVIFSSDNGPESYAFERAEKYGHFSMGDFRGLKRDVWEGGHRVPFIIKWPGSVEAGSVSDKLISQIDINENSGQHTAMPESFKKLRGYADFTTGGLLFNLEEDPEQRNNLYEKDPIRVKEMDQLIIEEKARGYLIQDN